MEGGAWATGMCVTSTCAADVWFTGKLNAGAGDTGAIDIGTIEAGTLGTASVIVGTGFAGAVLATET